MIPTILLNLSNLALYFPLFKLAIASVPNDSILNEAVTVAWTSALRIDSISAILPLSGTN